MKSEQVLPYLGALLNASIVGLSFLFTKLALEDASPADTLSYRFTLAFLVLLILQFFVPIKLPSFKNNGKSFVYLLLLALFYPTMFFSFQAFGLLYTSSAEGGILMAFAPILIAVLASVFLKEKTTIVQILFIFMSIFGVVYIFIMKGASIEFNSMLGFFLLFIACLSIAGYTVMARFLSVSYSPLQLSFIMVTFGFIFFNLYAIIQHLAAGDFVQYISLWTNTSFLLFTFYLGVLATLLTSFLSNYVLSKIPASQMSVFANLSTVISIIAGALILNEKIYPYHWVGAFFIIAGVIGTNAFKQKTKAANG
ncbi:DMT family transporter [Metabacillus idriensis]|uniref:DMT family transporter n=1 Tax=Metabacillus idriensis TaxID=324768 RepID=UPI00163B0281|nr:DMT family transporter [Metabacillus idriensis]QNG60617.1 DMT family transporter [Bacillus sp. PAMC26568]